MTPRVGDVVSIDGGMERWLVFDTCRLGCCTSVHNVEVITEAECVNPDRLTFLYTAEPYYRSHELLTDLYNRQDTWRSVGADTPDDSYLEAYARNLRHLSAVALAFAERVEQEMTDRRQDEVDRVAS